MSEIKEGITHEDRTAYADGIRIGIEKGRKFERSEILRILHKVKNLPEMQEVMEEIGNK